jgi:hypothetical protein
MENANFCAIGLEAYPKAKGVSTVDPGSRKKRIASKVNRTGAD